MEGNTKYQLAVRKIMLFSPSKVMYPLIFIHGAQIKKPFSKGLPACLINIFPEPVFQSERLLLVFCS